MIQKNVLVSALYFVTVLLLALPFQALAVTANQISSLVQIVCPDSYGNWISGSGTIIDSKGVILTNKHVVTDSHGDIIKTCFIGFVESINHEPNFGTETNPNLAGVKYFTTSEDEDAAILYLSNPTNKIYPYINIWGSDSDTLSFGNKLEVIGFPGIGGSTVTYTSGDFSGFGSRLDGTQNYIKASVPLDHGNSGGSAYNSVGQFIGIPTMVIPGELNSLSYILSVNSIKKWLTGLLGSAPAQSVTEQQPTVQAVQKTLPQDVAPPRFPSGAWNTFFHSNETGKEFSWNLNDDDSDITIRWSAASDESGVAGYYVYFGTDPNANPVSGGVFTKELSMHKILDLPGIYYLKVVARDGVGNISGAETGRYNYKVYPDWLINDPKAYLLATNRPTYYSIFDYSRGIKGNLLKKIKFDSTRSQIIYVASNNVLIEWDGPQNRANQGVRLDIGTTTDQCKGISSDSQWSQCFDLGILSNTMDQCKAPSTDSPWSQCVEKQYIMVNENQITRIGMQLNNKYNFEHSFYFTYETYVDKLGASFHPFVLIPTRSIPYKESVVSSGGGLSGRILLQVESHGEAWYVNPKDGKRYYMKDGPTAYEMMRRFGLGITDADLAQLPQAGEGRAYPSRLNSLKGKILLQVQSHGEAWYVHPQTGIRYYLKDGEAAYSLMRLYSLGITNKNLEAIPVGSF